MDKIKIIGAKEHNLKSIDLEIPKNKLVVFTGISGSGKSTLAFGTIYAEGQRRYMESLSSYARQFLDRVGKADVQKIEGLTPSIAIDQKTTSKNPRSTVGTITEIYDYMRLLYARIGDQYCHKCNKPISSMSASDIISEVLQLPQELKIIIMSPIVKEKKGSFADLLKGLLDKGFVRVNVDGVVVRLDENIKLSKTKKHSIKVIIDRVIVNDDNKERIASDIEKALLESNGEIEIEFLNHQDLGLQSNHLHYSERLSCSHCKISFSPLEPLSFSFNSPKGACRTCDGLGVKYGLDINKILKKDLSIDKGAIPAFMLASQAYYLKLLKTFCEIVNIDIKKSFEALDLHDQNLIINGSLEKFEFEFQGYKLEKSWDGIIRIIFDIYKDSKEINNYMTEKVCLDCKGLRLQPEHLAVKVADYTLGDLTNMSINSVYEFFKDDEFKSTFAYLSKQDRKIADPIIKEIRERLFFLNNVGLHYLSLARDARSISGGESQRIRIASQIGSGLTGVTYVLDEPSIGLHERDTLKLIETLRNLQEKGNTVIVVEHDTKTINNADFIVDIGPGAGKFGGEVVFSGTKKALYKSKCLTAQYLNGKKQINYSYHRKAKDYLYIENVNINNIVNLDVQIPLQVLCAISGVSGSGKSSLILQTLLPVAREILNHARKIQKVDGVHIEGLEYLDKVIYLDQNPIGRTPRSIPATYTGLMDDLRNLFSTTKEAKVRGYGISRFSFNVKGGRCEKCQGEGEIKVEMHFLPDIMVKCDDCQGKRYNAQTLEILYKGKSIADVLAMSITEACEFFKSHPKIMDKLNTLNEVGLDYISLGQNATTLSGGEAQRIKLSRELSRQDTGKTLYILDEPTTGLHFADVDKLVKVLHSLVNFGNSVVVIEHNLEVIKNADYIIDMGPDGGKAGGKIIACGTPEQLASDYEKTKSLTGEFLAEMF